jgi:hypothetical protein
MTSVGTSNLVFWFPFIGKGGWNTFSFSGKSLGKEVHWCKSLIYKNGGLNSETGKGI